MFPNRSACCMDLMPCHDDSLKESLKQTILIQENMFRKQVQELHRLYQIQTILTKNVTLKEYNPEIVERTSVSSYAKNFDKHFLNKGDGWGTREKPVEIEDNFHGDTESSVEETNLSLSIGRDSSRRMSGWRTQNEKPQFVVPRGVIEFEESIRMPLSTDVEFTPYLHSVACSAHSGENNGWQPSCSCANRTKEYLFGGANEYLSRRDKSTNIPEQNSLNQGDKEGLEKLPETGLAVVRKLFPSRGAACLDLNSPQPDESSLKDLEMDDASAAASSGIVIREFHISTSSDAVSRRKLDGNCSTQVPPLNSISVVSKITESPNASRSKPCSIDLESYPMSPSDSGEEDHGCLGKSAERIRDLPSRNCKDEPVTEVNREKGDEVLVHSYLCISGEAAEDVVIGERSPSLSEADQIAPDPSSSLKTMQSGTYLKRSFSRQNSDSSQVDSSAAVVESKSRSSGEENEGSASDDPVIQKGAASLVYFLLEARREHEVKRTKIDEPERSMDSFETNVLKLQESNTDDYCVSSSNPYEINEMDKKDCGIKLKRGRRMKDFQKEILPSLPSLSRQEICEDIRIMEGAMRSREYKRSRSKITAEQKWCTPQCC